MAATSSVESSTCKKRYCRQAGTAATTRIMQPPCWRVVFSGDSKDDPPPRKLYSPCRICQETKLSMLAIAGVTVGRRRSPVACASLGRFRPARLPSSAAGPAEPYHSRRLLAYQPPTATVMTTSATPHGCFAIWRTTTEPRTHLRGSVINPICSRYLCFPQASMGQPASFASLNMFFVVS
jgi:hypothetical protein